MMRYLLICNPGSRSGRSPRRIDRILAFFRDHKLEFDFKLTKRLDDAYRLSREANCSGYDVIVAVGGDGTINRVLNGFYDTAGKRISDSVMGVLYSGTSPDLCRSYNIPYRMEEALETLQRGKTTDIQVGKITLARTHNPSYKNYPVTEGEDFQTSYFACCANIGIGARIASYANNGMRKWAGDRLGTFISVLRSLASHHRRPLSIVRDGKPETVEKAINLSVGKTFFVASGLKVRNCLEEGDSRFYCLVMGDLGLPDLILCLRSLYKGLRIKGNCLYRLEYCRSIHILGNNGRTEVEFEGDPQGFLPCRIEMAEDKLELIVR